MLAIVDLPAPDRPVNQRMAGFCCFERRALGLADQQRLPVDVGAAPQPEGDHAGADGVVGEPVDDDERAGLAGSPRRDRTRPESPVDRLQKPMSLRPSVCAARCSRVLTSILYLMRGDRDRQSSWCRSAPDRSGPGTSGSSLIQITWAANWSDTSGRAVGLTSTSPRAISISSVKRERNRIAGFRRRRAARHR